ncbi:hypothetical protein D3C72_175820 [compost metagenome]
MPLVCLSSKPPSVGSAHPRVREMDVQSLADLDELHTLCRDKRARGHLAEAVRCYKAGAYRQAIVATWIAVVFDFINKLEELELAGDAQAKAQLAQLETIRLNGDTQASLTFEKNLLKVARDDFQLISPQEFLDLERLQADRHRCAHPTLQTLDEPYQPSPELARYHIRNAVIYLLQHPPVQGKAALNRLFQEVASAYFPTDTDGACRHLEQGPLQRPRESLVRDFVIGLSNSLLLESKEHSERQRMFAALLAAEHLHPSALSRSLAGKLPGYAKRISDSEYWRVVAFISRVPEAWEILDAADRLKAENFISSANGAYVGQALADALIVRDLHRRAIARLPKVDVRLVVPHLDLQRVSEEVIDALLSKFEGAGSFNESLLIAEQVIEPLIPRLNMDQIRRIFHAFTANTQVHGSWGVAPVLLRLVERPSLPLEQFRSELKEIHNKLSRWGSSLVSEGTALYSLIQITSRFSDTESSGN